MALTKIRSDKGYYSVYTATVNATGLNASDQIVTQEFFQSTFQVLHAGHTAGTSTWELQSTIDGTNWDTVAGTSSVTSGAAGSTSLTFAATPGSFIRLKVTIANATPGATLQVYFNGRRMS